MKSFFKFAPPVTFQSYSLITLFLTVNKQIINKITPLNEIKKKIIESLKGTLGISYKETRTTNEAVGYKVVHTVPAGKVGHINLYYKGYKIGGRLTVWTANTSNPSQSKRYATYDVNSTLYPSDTLDIFSESYNANT